MERNHRRSPPPPLSSSSSSSFSSSRSAVRDSRNLASSWSSQVRNRNASSIDSRGRSSGSPPPKSADSDGPDPVGTSSGREKDAEDSSRDFPSLVGTCPFMCPPLRWPNVNDYAIWLCLRGCMEILLSRLLIWL